MNAVTLGPVVLSGERFVALLVLVTLVLVSELISRRIDKRLSHWASNTVIVALLGARLGFVLMHLRVYLKAPLSIFYIWQGGFAAFWGIGLVIIYTLWFYRQDLKAARWTLTPGLAALVVYLSFLGVTLPKSSDIALPDVSLEQLSGTMLELSSLKGKPVVLNIWATWCGPCQRELPMLIEADAAHPDLPIVFVDQRETQETVAAYLDKRSLNPDYVLLDRQGYLGDSFKVIGTPTTLFFNSEGQLVKRHVGEISRAAFDDAVKALQ